MHSVLLLYPVLKKVNFEALIYKKTTSKLNNNLFAKHG